MGQQLQNINLATLAQNTNARQGDTLNATPTGTTVNDTTFRFDNVNAVVGAATAVAVATAAATGTVITITAPGVYAIDFTAALAGAVSAAVGIMINGTPDSTDPVLGTNGVIQALDVTGVAALLMPCVLSTVIYVTNAQAQAGLTVRFAGSDSAGAPPAGFTAATAGYRVAQIAQVGF